MSPTRRDFLELAAATTLASCTHAPHVRPPTKEPTMSAIQTRPLMTLRLATAATQELGAGPHGTRLIFPITGGTFEGDRLRGTVLAGGEDWAIKRADGVIELDLRVTLATDDGVLIHMTFEGIRDDATPGAPYFRTFPRFEAGDGKYAFLNRLLAVGVGEIRADGPVHLIDEIL